jgi:hypothetical protein
MATQRFPQERHARLRLDEQLRHALSARGPRIPAVAPRDVPALRLRFLLTVRAPIDMQARTVEMGNAGRKAQTLSDGRRSQTGECRHPVVIEGIQGTPEGVIMEWCRGNAGRNASIRRRSVEESGNQSARVIDTPQAIEPHGFDRLTSGEVPHCRMLLGRLLEDVANAECIAHPSDEAEVVQDLVTVWGLVGPDHLLY